jgi:hypothetical protein
MAHRTVRCAAGHCPVRQPRYPIVRVRPLELWHVGPPDSLVRLLALLWLLRAQARTVHVHCSLLQTTVGADSHCSAGTPDSPVNYSGVAPRIPEASKFKVDLPGAPDTVRWCNGHCLVRHTRAAFGCLLLFLFEPFLGLFIGLCWTFGTCRTHNLEQTS